ncbi:MAG TPA: polysaccharide deacetylase family protein [Vicinamibacterales bacterium]|nr:polysaccharide deacetylase family protein [Vicinamibacterales bacterium]
MLRNHEWPRWSMKVALASTIAGACRLPVLDGFVRARRPLILGYHRVVENFAVAALTEMPNMLISVSMFERHLEWLGRQFRFVSLDDIGEHAVSGVPFDGPVAAITFDDGYRDVYEQAYPTLKRMGIPAAVFVVTDLVGGDGCQIHDKLYHLLARAFARWDDPRRELLGVLEELEIPSGHLFPTRATTRSPLLTVTALLPSLTQRDVRRVLAYLESVVGPAASDMPRSLTWQMIAEMGRAGFTIGSHTKTHASLPMETPEAAVEEIAGSKRALEAHLGKPVVHFAYPGGQFTPGVVDAVAAAGYQCGYTACPHHDPRHPTVTMERLLLSEGSSIDATGRFSPPILSCQVHDLWPPARRCEWNHA